MKQKFANALSLALIVAMLLTSVALADNVVNNVDTTVDNAAETRTIIAGNSTVVGFYIDATNTGGDANGCNATGSDKAYGTLSVSSANVTASQTNNIEFVGCGSANAVPVTFSSSTPGSYTIKILSVTGGKAGSQWNLTTSDFTLVVNPAPVTNTPPSLNLPGNQTAEATSASGAVVSYTATASDTQDGALTPSCSPTSGSTFPLGATTVSCSVTDSGGLSANGSFTVTVQDTTPPALSLPSTLTAEATSGSGASVTYTATATDLVDGAVSVTCSPASGSTFPLGTTTVNCSAKDSRNNTKSGSFSVTVQDTTAPTVTVPSNITQEATGPSGNVVTFTASATDTVDGNLPVTCTPASGSTFPIAPTTVTCTATDSHSNAGSGSFSVTIADTIAPVIAAHGDESAEATGPNGAVVSYTAPATSDAVDGLGVASCSPASGSTFPLGSTTVTCTKSDAAGNAATATTFQVHVVDTTDPTITFVSRTSANGNGWNNGNVTVTWSCTDLVGVQSDTVTTTVTTEGADQSALGTCTDTSGNTASDTQTGINIDKTAPTTSASRTPAANSFGWNNSDITVSFSGNDGSGSGIDFCDAAVVLSNEGANQLASGTCTDEAGNVSAPASVTGINIDKTAPTTSASRTPAANLNGWNNTDVTVSFSGNDGSGSGIAVCDAAITLSSEGAGQSASGTCTDKAGNLSAPASASNINIDKTNPLVSLVGGPANGGTYYFGFVPAAPTCSASDALSGLDGACSVSGYGAAIGAHTVTATANDKAGNSASASASYTVSAWTLRGFYQPVDMSGVFNTVKNGSTVPLKFEIFAGPTEITDLSAISSLAAARVSCTVGPEDAIEITATGGTSLRYDAVAGQFIYNWKTPAGAGSCYRITMTTADGSSLVAYFKLK